MRKLDGNEYYIFGTNEIVKECAGGYIFDGEFAIVMEIDDRINENELTDEPLILEMEDRDEGEEEEPHLYNGELSKFVVVRSFSPVQMRIIASDTENYNERIANES